MSTTIISLGAYGFPTSITPLPCIPPSTKPTLVILGKTTTAFAFWSKALTGASEFLRIVVVKEFDAFSTSSSFATSAKTQKIASKIFLIFYLNLTYFAISIALVSRITFTLISPGYCTLLSISAAISLATSTASSSFMSLAFAITRISRPAFIA